MFAVVQIGSNTRRSPCMTARSVPASPAAASARRIIGAKTPAASPLPITLRREMLTVAPYHCYAGMIAHRDTRVAVLALRPDFTVTLGVNSPQPACRATVPANTSPALGGKGRGAQRRG